MKPCNGWSSSIMVHLGWSLLGCGFHHPFTFYLSLTCLTPSHARQHKPNTSHTLTNTSSSRGLLVYSKCAMFVGWRKLCSVFIGNTNSYRFLLLKTCPGSFLMELSLPWFPLLPCPLQIASRGQEANRGRANCGLRSPVFTDMVDSYY